MANNIRIERARLKMSQSELAEALNVTAGTVCSWEKDIGSCSTLKLLEMSNIFGTSTDYIIGVTDRRERVI